MKSAAAAGSTAGGIAVNVTVTYPDGRESDALDRLRHHVADVEAQLGAGMPVLLGDDRGQHDAPPDGYVLRKAAYRDVWAGLRNTLGTAAEPQDVRKGDN